LAVPQAGGTLVDEQLLSTPPLIALQVQLKVVPLTVTALDVPTEHKSVVGISTELLPLAVPQTPSLFLGAVQAESSVVADALLPLHDQA